MKDETEASVITGIERQKRNKKRYNVYVDEEYTCSVHEDILIKNRLLKGEQIDAQRLKQALEEDERHEAYLKAIRFVAVRPRSVQEVKMKLKDLGYEADLIDWTVGRLLEQKYLDDADFAKLWTEQRIQYQRKGRNAVRYELAQKGLSRDEISNALSAVDTEEEMEGALIVGRKKWKTVSGERMDRKRKTMAFLLRRGYTSSLVNDVMRRLSDEELENEE
ncbi:RecX family transcriptional regulator [Paenibacillus sp. UNC499MF]|uniref:RecX family transcriptional regulator n=1 Tax=Paenibacillus sp. UNC499MF TaxID=1502751 RepID=UPI0008A07282|nr:RecX family transcriptional regulator [Paenibacillus sp. UNC499MF]SEF60357.1 regulatory protein [Paenibacillus sp. UNC499MF]